MLEKMLKLNYDYIRTLSEKLIYILFNYVEGNQSCEIIKYSQVRIVEILRMKVYLIKRNNNNNKSLHYRPAKWVFLFFYF